MDVALLAPDEPLSPELVLVLPPELRAQVLARLPAPVWLRPRPRVIAVSAAGNPAARTLGRILVARTEQLARIFVAITILTIAMSVVARALR
jgi:hypothetical protein